MLATSLRSRALPTLAAVGTVAATVAASAAAAPAASAASYGFRPLGATVRTNGTATAGALFPNGTGSNHTCSGTVVSAGGEPVVAVAAHCVNGSAVGWKFVPGYRAGAAPYGVWTVEAQYLDSRWNNGRGSAYDVAILRLKKQWINGGMRHVGYRTGSTILSGAPRTDTIVDIVGYPIGRGDYARGCSNKFYWKNGFGYTSCGGLLTGVSGSGLRYGNDGRGHQYLGGLIGGYHQGGCSSSDAYTPVFGSWVTALVKRANSYAPSTGYVSPGSDGCYPGRP